MVTLKYRGRLGNNLIQYAAAHILAKRAGLALNVSAIRGYPNTHSYKTSINSKEWTITNICSIFQIKPLNGNKFDEIINLTDKNYFEHLENPLSNVGYHLNGFFQHPKLLRRYRKHILRLYKLPNSDSIVGENDAFAACRLGDLLLKPNLQPYFTIEYLRKQLETQRDAYDKVYITSDTIDHPPLTKLIKEYDLTIYQDEPIQTILFAAQFNNLILSDGTFSFWMAYLSKASNISVYSRFRPPQMPVKIWRSLDNLKFF